MVLYQPSPRSCDILPHVPSLLMTIVFALVILSLPPTTSSTIYTLDQTLDDPINIIWSISITRDSQIMIVGLLGINAYIYQKDSTTFNYGLSQTLSPGHAVVSAHITNDGQLLALGLSNNQVKVY